jgi:23S rRNA pseudouridine1911/1915/1917 synthase
MDMKIKILFENDDCLVIDKPAGLVVHPDGRTEEPTLVDWILATYPEIRGVGEDTELTDGGTIERPGIVHRLDRDTSGCLVIAKHRRAYKSLKRQFKEHTVHKSYYAFCAGELKNEQGIIDKPIARSKGDFRRWSAERGKRGELHDAVTKYFVAGKGQGFSFVELNPKTGRTHQLRVHMKSVGYPIICDPLYAPQIGCPLGFSRVALHARSLVFKDLAEQDVVVNSPFPADFKAALKVLALPEPAPLR